MHLSKSRGLRFHICLLIETESLLKPLSPGHAIKQNPCHLPPGKPELPTAQCGLCALSIPAFGTPFPHSSHPVTPEPGYAGIWWQTAEGTPRMLQWKGHFLVCQCKIQCSWSSTMLRKGANAISNDTRRSQIVVMFLCWEYVCTDVPELVSVTERRYLD